ncbi:ribosome biogenesis GTPase YlqF [Sporanaerobacter acetigenes]|uniref:Ribosome biogenesis GTPase A n=1 Tax=Sporanaerobacter acetigenes DSM 13106 TaxID=1123281 RepID=A0A1M5XYP1_9FIRM|nr:ribosome biogenesis GTPase YlqF [Sporanaerobacter acetigenes]SHI04910.1 ribosome biogenesis GTPase A [Sporanaerobacter acetigenes DSM 13106]
MNINWYPGHMKKTKESIKKNLQLVDIIYELLDARIPISSENPDIDSIVGDKPRIVILNKSDLSSHEGNMKWQQYYQNKGISSVLVDSLNNRGLNEVINISNELMKEKKLKLEKKGIKNKPIRAMIVGIPNVGKSTLINSLSGRKGAKTGNRPGITKGNQWIKLKGNLELLDTPGILWPKFEDESVGLNLAFTGAIKDELLDIESLAFKLVERLVETYPQFLEDRYNINVHEKTTYEIVENIAQNRGCIGKGQEIDFTKVSNIIIDDFRKGRIGRITLELP